MLAKAIAIVGFAAASSAFAQVPQLKIACSARVSGSINDLYVMNPDGTEVTNLTGDFAPSIDDVHISPSGKQIAFTALSGSGPGSIQVYVMNSDGTNRHPVTNLNHSYGPICFGWLDDSHVLFRWAPGPSQGDLFTLDLTTGQMELLLPASAVGQGSIDDAAISPDRRKIVFTAQAGSWSPTLDIYTLNLDTNVAQCLYADAIDNYQDRSPRWSSNTAIVWTHNMNASLSDNFAVVEKSITSLRPCSQYDRTVAPAQGPSSNVGILDGIPDTRVALVLRSPTQDLARLDLDTGAETVVLPGMHMNYADWGIIVLPDYSCPADFDGNGGIDGGDLAAFFLHFEQGC